MGLLTAVFSGPDQEKDDLRHRLAELEETNKIRSGYSSVLTDEQVQQIRIERTKEAQRRQLDDENDAVHVKQEADRTARIRKLGVTMVKDGRLVIVTNQTRIKTIGSDLSIPCPHCGKPLHHVSNGVIELVRSYDATPSDDLCGVDSQVLVRNARDPLGSFIGVAGFLDGGHCPECDHVFRVFAQLVLG